MRRARLAWLVLSIVAVSGCSQPLRPNVLLITLDTTRADRLGSYGYEPSPSPVLDRVAREGVVFTQAIAQASVTPVSHASILTGLNPYSHGLRVMHGTSRNRLPDSNITLAEVLKDSGYRTAAFVSAFPVTERFGLHQGFERFDAGFLGDADVPPVSAQGVVNTGSSQRHAGETSDLVVEWIRDADEPFLLWIHYFDPHDPRVGPPRSFLREYSRADDTPKDTRSLLRAYYDMEIAYMDSQIGRVRQALEDRESWEETIVIVVADHGEGLGDHDWWTHGILYQEQIRVPLIIRAPGVPGARRIDPIVRTIDIFPTVLELAGIEEGSSLEVDGRSLVPLLDGASDAPKSIAYSDSLNTLTYRFHRDIVDEKNERLFSVIEWPWKYIHHPDREDESELFHLEDDAGEQHNVLAAKPEVAARLRALLEPHVADAEPAAGAKQMSPEDVERLEALGYVH